MARRNHVGNVQKWFLREGERSEPVCKSHARNQLFCVLLECWNDVLLEPWKERVPGSERLISRQVKRLVLSGVIPTIQQQRELFRAFHTLSIKKSDNVKKITMCTLICCWIVGMTCPWTLGKNVPLEGGRPRSVDYRVVVRSCSFQQSNKSHFQSS
jgi:hypothetical protein